MQRFGLDGTGTCDSVGLRRRRRMEIAATKRQVRVLNPRANLRAHWMLFRPVTQSCRCRNNRDGVRGTREGQIGPRTPLPSITCSRTIAARGGVAARGLLRYARSWSMILKVLFGALGLGLLMVVHEMGHHLVARAFHMRVVKFSIGFGPSPVALSTQRQPDHLSNRSNTLRRVCSDRWNEPF